MFDFLRPIADRMTTAVVGKGRMTDEQCIVTEINRFIASRRRMDMLTGERYFEGRHDILSRVRTMIGKDGELEEVKNLPNNRIVDNQYKKAVIQKTNYLLGQPISVKCENTKYAKALRKIFNKRFQRLMKHIGEDSLNCGIGWLFVHYDEKGNIAFKRFKPFEIIPGWKDAEHTELEYAIRLYEVIAYEGTQEKVLKKVEVYDGNGITFFELSDGGSLKPCEPFQQSYFTVTDGEGEETGYNWTKIPLVPFKYNSKEIPLIKMVKNLQDGLNIILSNFQNNMEEDIRNTILILKNYDGQNLGEFRKNLAAVGAVKVKTVDGADGGVDKLTIEVNCENYKAIIEIFKKAIIENAMSYDAKDDRLAGNPNQMNIQSMYSDVDLDANNMETEFQASFEDLLWFVNCYLANIGVGDFEGEEVEIIFNRDILINEGEVIDNCQKSSGILSDETIVANHPWVDDPLAELERLKKQKAEEVEQFGDPFAPANSGNEEKPSEETEE